MASRAVGAILAVVSALALAGALVSGLVPGSVVPGWWDGHPEVDGKVIERKQLRVGLLNATGCNLGETLVCEDKKLDLGDTTKLAGLGELAALGLAELVGIALIVTIARLGKRRRTVGKLALVTAVLAGAGAGALAYLGPDLAVKQQVDVPIGLGLLVAWGAAGTALFAGVIAMRLEPEPLRLKPSMANVAVDPALANTLDVREMLRDQHGALSPASLGPEPMIGGNLSAPVTPLRGSPAPLVPQAPQLRPLYDMQGAAPVPAPPVLPVAPPTPVPRASIRALAGIDTPPPAVESPVARAMREHPVAPPAPNDRPDSQPIEPPPPPLRLPTLADVPRKPPTLPPPQPPAPPAPAARPSPVPRGSQPAMQPPQRPSQRPSQPPPPLGRKTPMAGEPPIGRKTPMAGEQPIPEKIPEKRTIAHAIPPMPNRAETEDDDKRPTGVRDVVENPVTAVEIDAEAKAAHVAKQQQAARQAALVAAKQQMLAKQHAAETAQMIEGSDTGVEVAPPTAPPAARNEPTDQMEVVAAIAERPATATEEVKLPISTAPASLPPPKKTETAISGPTPACPQCEAPMAWVEEHLRFYCKQCKMYF